VTSRPTDDGRSLGSGTHELHPRTIAPNAIPLKPLPQLLHPHHPTPPIRPAAPSLISTPNLALGGRSRTRPKLLIKIDRIAPCSSASRYPHHNGVQEEGSAQGT
jgi:hypothetical protein